jgi:hypothetical protein
MEQRFTTLGYRVQLTEDEGIWVATARRLDTGDAFGPPVPADDAHEAADLLARWIEWQHAHTLALTALQSAESAYHRLAAETFSSPDDTEARTARRSALAQIDDLRQQLDQVREQRPWPH